MLAWLLQLPFVLLILRRVEKCFSFFLRGAFAYHAHQGRAPGIGSAERHNTAAPYRVTTSEAQLFINANGIAKLI